MRNRKVKIIIALCLSLLTAFSPVMAEETIAEPTTVETPENTAPTPVQEPEPSAADTPAPTAEPEPQQEEKKTAPTALEAEPTPEQPEANAVLSAEPRAVSETTGDWPADNTFNIANGKLTVTQDENGNLMVVQRTGTSPDFNNITYQLPEADTPIVIMGNVTNTAKDGITKDSGEPTAAAEAKWQYVSVESGVNVNITLKALTINAGSTGVTRGPGTQPHTRANGCAPIQILGNAVAVFTLEGDTALTGGAGRAGLEAAKNENDTPTIRIKGDGKLTVTGGTCGAGIGSPSGCGPVSDNFSVNGKNTAGPNIIIDSGTINATGGKFGAGIGTGRVCARGNTSGYIEINGGTVTATATQQAAGIGGGDDGDGCEVTINGGTVIATGHASPGIGGGQGDTNHSYGKMGNVTINGGEVNTNGIGDTIDNGATDSSTITVNGGTINNTGNTIGKNSGQTVIINGGSVNGDIGSNVKTETTDENGNTTTDIVKITITLEGITTAQPVTCAIGGETPWEATTTAASSGCTLSTYKAASAEARTVQVKLLNEVTVTGSDGSSVTYPAGSIFSGTLAGSATAITLSSKAVSMSGAAEGMSMFIYNTGYIFAASQLDNPESNDNFTAYTGAYSLNADGNETIVPVMVVDGSPVINLSGLRIVPAGAALTVKNGASATVSAIGADSALAGSVNYPGVALEGTAQLRLTDGGSKLTISTAVPEDETAAAAAKACGVQTSDQSSITIMGGDNTIIGHNAPAIGGADGGPVGQVTINGGHNDLSGTAAIKGNGGTFKMTSGNLHAPDMAVELGDTGTVIIDGGSVHTPVIANVKNSSGTALRYMTAAIEGYPGGGDYHSNQLFNCSIGDFAAWSAQPDNGSLHIYVPAAEAALVRVTDTSSSSDYIGATVTEASVTTVGLKPVNPASLNLARFAEMNIYLYAGGYSIMAMGKPAPAAPQFDWTSTSAFGFYTDKAEAGIGNVTIQTSVQVVSTGPAGRTIRILSPGLTTQGSFEQKSGNVYLNLADGSTSSFSNMTQTKGAGLTVQNGRGSLSTGSMGGADAGYIAVNGGSITVTGTVQTANVFRMTAGTLSADTMTVPPSITENRDTGSAGIQAVTNSNTLVVDGGSLRMNTITNNNQPQRFSSDVQSSGGSYTIQGTPVYKTTVTLSTAASPGDAVANVWLSYQLGSNGANALGIAAKTDKDGRLYLYRPATTANSATGTAGLGDDRYITAALSANGAVYDGYIANTNANDKTGSLIRQDTSTDYTIGIPQSIPLPERSPAVSGSTSKDNSVAFTLTNGTKNYAGVKELSVAVSGSGTDGAFSIQSGEKSLPFQVYDSEAAEVTHGGNLKTWILDGSNAEVTGKITVKGSDIDKFSFENDANVFYDLSGSLTFTPTLSYRIQ